MYIDAATGTVETVAHVAEALAARAVEATLDANVDAGDEDPQTETFTGPSLLRLQLRAVSTLLGAQSRKHAERLAALHARYREVDVCREAQDRLLRFAEVEDDVRAARGLARRGRGARRGKWSPPGGGVFLNSGTNAQSHNANASYARDAGFEGRARSVRESRSPSWRSDPADPDPFRGSAFSRSVLVALGDKLLMKAALGVFAAGAALARARRAYCTKVWRRNAAGRRARRSPRCATPRGARAMPNRKPTRTTDASRPRRVSNPETKTKHRAASLCSSRTTPSS